MIGLETRMILRHYLAQGLPKAEISRRLGINERTIRRWIAAGELERDPEDPPRYGPRPPRVTKLDPFRDYIEERLKRYEKLSAVRLLEEIRANGYAGGYSQLKVFVRQVRPKPSAEPIIRFETPPGHQTQVDFAEFDFPWGKRFALVVVLAYSRLLWLRFYERQDMRTLFVGLEEAFRYFGGLTREVLFDQMKAVITADLRLFGGQLVVNEEFLRFAAHWGFRPRACRAYRAQTKGKVERPIRYVRDNFIYARDFAGDAHLNEEVFRWLERANGRVHATTKEIPRVRVERDERHLLLPLAARPYRSLLLPVHPQPSTELTRRAPHIEVEKRSLSVYAAAVGGF